MTPPQNIALIGYRGVGKTTVAQRLALALGWQWVDADVELELEAGRSITEIFASEGEPAFRERENQILARLVERPQTVVALGGGVVLRADNRQLMSKFSHVAWLKAAPETLAERIAACPTSAGRRPNLTSAGGLPEIQSLLAQRTPLYQQCATLVVDTENKSPADVAEEILDRLSEREKVSGTFLR